jgi:hypothetical protein
MCHTSANAVTEVDVGNKLEEMHINFFPFAA